MSVGAGKGKVEIKDVKDPRAEHDPEYLKVVKEIQEGNTRYNRGTAFDRQDLLYLSDFKDAEHQKELEIRDTEASEFAKLRSRLDGSSEAAPISLATAGSGATNGANGGGTTLRVAVKEKQPLRAASKLLPAVKVLSPRDGLGGGLGGGGPLKRARTGSSEVTDHEVGGAARQLSVGAPGHAGVQGQPSVLMPLPDPDNTRVAPEGSGHGKEPEDGLLQGLLGGYGSSSDAGDEDGDVAKGGNGPQVTAGRAGSGLPSAADLLGGPSGLLMDLESGRPPPATTAAPEPSADSGDESD